MPENQPVLRLVGITKAFPGIVANDEVSLDVMSGSIHCLLGENGAGKSTLISILSGMQRPDRGTIELRGRAETISSPSAAIGMGIGVVYQHSTLVPALTILENLMLGNSGKLLQDRTGALRRFEELSSLLGIDLDPRMRASALGVGQQQQVEIAKALWKDSRILILDEPTSLLPPSLVDALLASILNLASRGISVILVTHKLDEALSVADAVTVLRRGRVALSLSADKLLEKGVVSAEERILGAMFGERESVEPETSAEPKASEPKASEPKASEPKSSEATRAGRQETTRRVEQTARIVLEVRDVETAPPGSGRMAHGDAPLAGISLTIRSGELLGISGIEGNGQKTLAEVIAGQRAISSGSILHNGSEISDSGVAMRQADGVRYVTDDRLGEGIAGDQSVAINLVLKKIGRPPMWRRGITRKAEIERGARVLVREHDIRTPSIDARAATLSGGNIQKLLLARELDGMPSVVVFNKPTYGLDHNTVLRVRREMSEFVAAGGAAILISSDLGELAQMSQRIHVMDAGRIVGTVDGAETAPDEIVARIGAIIAGVHAAGGHAAGFRATGDQS